MKAVKFLKFFAVAGLVVLLTAKGAYAAFDTSGLCTLITEMQKVFKLLRTVAFVGAAFILVKWAWDLISTGKLGGKDKITEGLAAVGLPMIIGFLILFSIGIILTFLLSGNIVDCPNLTTGWQ